MDRTLVIEVGRYRGGTWLLFFLFRAEAGVVERRRLTTFPPNWYELPQASLAALFSDAAPVRPVGAKAMVGGPRAPGADAGTAPDAENELESARSALDVAHLQLDSLALALADREAELEQTREELASLNAEIQEMYARTARRSAHARRPRLDHSDSAAPND